MSESQTVLLFRQLALVPFPDSSRTRQTTSSLQLTGLAALKIVELYGPNFTLHFRWIFHSFLTMVSFSMFCLFVLFQWGPSVYSNSPKIQNHVKQVIILKMHSNNLIVQGWDSPTSSITFFSSSRAFHWKSSSLQQRLVNLTPGFHL